MPRAGRTATAAHDPRPSHEDVLDELKALRDLIERHLVLGKDDMTRDSRSRDDERDRHAVRRTRQEIANLHYGTFNGDGRARAAQELDAVVEGTERATHQILQAAETIEETASALAAILEREQDQALARDIRAHVIRIFEACSFQDIGCQRIAGVLATLKFIEERIAHMMEIWGGDGTQADAARGDHGDERQLLRGPRLDGEPGHASQEEVDALFAAR